MTIHIPVESLAEELTNHIRTSPTTLELALCLNASWSNPPTEAEIIASVIADQNGYTKQDATPTADATTSGTKAIITCQDMSISLTSSTLNYDAIAIIRNSTEVVYAQDFSGTQTIDSAGSAHEFNGIKISRNAVTG